MTILIKLIPIALLIGLSWLAAVILAEIKERRRKGR